MKKIAIIGAGISGLYLANLLEKEKDFDYKIFEKRSKLNLEEGYGIQLSVNSIKLLNKIGFKNITASDICFPKKINFFNLNKPNKICDIDISQFNDDLNRYTTTKRSTVLKFLLDDIPKDKIKFNTILNNLEYSNSFKAYFSDESEENFDFVIIADGVFSQSKLIISKEILKPKYNNSIALRGKLNKCDESNI